MTALFSLQDRAALVTGSSRGIGLATARLLGGLGARVMLSSDQVDELGEAEAALSAEGLTVAATPCDVTDAAALEHLVDETRRRCGGLDLLVCNAGITGGGPGADPFDLADHDRVMAVNLRSLVALTGLALPGMAASGGGAVVLMASIAGLRGNAAINAYALAKAGVAQLARNLAVQWGPRGVRVNAVSPGLIATGFSSPLLDDDAFMARRMAMTPLRRPGKIAEVAGAAVFLASRAGGFVTGHNLVVDGGTVISDGS